MRFSQMAWNYSSSRSSEAQPGFDRVMAGADRLADRARLSPGASARLGPLVEDRVYCADTVADAARGFPVDPAEVIGACPGE